MSHLLGFPKTHILDLLTMFFHPSNVPFIGFDFLLSYFSAQCEHSLKNTLIIVVFTLPVSTYFRLHHFYQKMAGDYAEFAFKAFEFLNEISKIELISNFS